MDRLERGWAGVGVATVGDDILPEVAEDMGPGEHTPQIDFLSRTPTPDTFLYPPPHTHTHPPLTTHLLPPSPPPFRTHTLPHLTHFRPLTHSEATIRFLKAKLRVMQEEMDRLCQENREKVTSSTLTCSVYTLPDLYISP